MRLGRNGWPTTFLEWLTMKYNGREMKQKAHAIVDEDGKVVYNAITMANSMPEHSAWLKFFDVKPYKLPLADAINAYEAIGYRYVEFELVEREREEI